ncbi:hypothetical protein PAXINDRAFT_11778 [Paxillus involutus ATCC 200175]|uniref:Uncharacterized protein n=1 Tax=Paxillus involutus ATCC 200175 TaxID=664439 RepID=A0A0C9TJA9_PAXIN|nr:hypothetical protein PAXINDRAFT_11778 [Paxillus involutus ATCC 200175]
MNPTDILRHESRYTNEPPALYQQSRQEHAQWPPRPTERDTYDRVPRGCPDYGPRHPLPTCDPGCYHFQLPQRTIYFVGPNGQYPVPVCDEHTTYPVPYENLYKPEHKPLPNTATPPQHDPAEPFIPSSLHSPTQDPRHTPSIVEQHRDQPTSLPHPASMYSFIPPHRMTNQYSYQRAYHRSAEAELTEPARADAASRSASRLSSTVEGIFTDGAAPVPAGQGLPRDQSLPPRPTMPPWEVVGERNVLGLHGGDIVETVIINGVPVTALRCSPKHAGTMNSLSSGTSTLSSMVLLELPAVNPLDSPEQRKAREEISAYLRATNTPAHVVFFPSHEADDMEEPKRKEPKGKERARDEPIAEQSSAPSLSAPEYQRQDDTEDPAHHASSSTMKSYVRKTGPTARGIRINVPPMMATSSADLLHLLSPKQSQTPREPVTPSVPPTAHTPKETQNESSIHYHPQAPNLMPMSPPPTRAEPHARRRSQTQSTEYLTPPETPQRTSRSGSQASSLLRRSDEDLPATPEEHVQTVPQEANESRESVEADEFEADLRFNVGVLARQCLREAETMTTAFARCNTLSSEALDSARSTHVLLSMALTATLGPLGREVDVNIDLTDNHQLSWRDRYEGMVASMHRTMNRVSGLLNEFPRGDRIRRHLASVSAVAERLDYLTRKLEDSIDRITYIRLASQLKAKHTAIRKSNITEEARRETFQTFSHGENMEIEGLRQRMNQLEARRRAQRSDPTSEESGLESA